MKIGVDIVHIERIEKLLKDEAQLSAVFSPEEVVEDVRTMAGRFAAKEAYFKARQEKGDWKDVIVGKNASGAPYLICPENNVSLSISHDGEYAIAAVVIY